MSDDPLVFLPDGREITVGLHAGIPGHLYRELPGVSASMLKIIHNEAPAALRYELDNPTPPTEAMALGSAIHDCVLLPDVWASAYVRGIEGDGRTKAVREAREAQAAEHPNATVLTPADFDTCLGVREAVAAHPRARALLEGDAEQSALWTDEGTGLLCRGRFDLLGGRGPWIVDLKSTQSAAPEKFSRSIYDHLYFAQAAMYIDGARALGLDYSRFVFVAAQKRPPYLVAVYELKADVINLGREVLRPLLETYAWCVETDTWPGYGDDVMLVELPAYAYKQLDDRY